jgi:hypothetical protein
MLAGGPLRASPATLLVKSGLVGAFARRLVVTEAVGGALLGVDPLDGGASPLPVSPLAEVAGLRAEGPVRVADLVAAPVVLDLGGGLPPGPPTPRRRRHRAERVQDIAGPVRNSAVDSCWRSGLLGVSMANLWPPARDSCTYSQFTSSPPVRRTRARPRVSPWARWPVVA